MLKGDKLQASVSSVFDRFEVFFFQKSHNLAQTTNGWMIGTLPKRFPKFMVPKPIPKFTWHSFIKTSQRQVCFILNGSESWEMKQDVTWPSCWKFLLAFAKASMVHEDRRILAGPVLKGLLLVKSFQNPVSFSNKDSGTSIVSLHPRRGEKQLEEVNRYHRSAWTFRWKLGPMVNWLITYTLIDRFTQNMKVDSLHSTSLYQNMHGFLLACIHSDHLGLASSNSSKAPGAIMVSSLVREACLAPHQDISHRYLTDQKKRLVHACSM